MDADRDRSDEECDHGAELVGAGPTVVERHDRIDEETDSGHADQQSEPAREIPCGSGVPGDSSQIDRTQHDRKDEAAGEEDPAETVPEKLSAEIEHGIRDHEREGPDEATQQGAATDSQDRDDLENRNPGEDLHRVAMARLASDYGDGMGRDRVGEARDDEDSEHDEADCFHGDCIGGSETGVKSPHNRSRIV